MTDLETAIMIKNMAREMVKKATVKNDERDELRKLQDKVVKRLEREGWKDSDTLEDLWSGNRPISLRDIKQYLYPQFKNLFQDFIK